MCFIRMRFNKQKTGDHDVWRVFVDGREFNVADIRIDGVSVCSDSTVEKGERKWNLCCEGEVMIVNGVAFISAVRSHATAAST